MDNGRADVATYWMLRALVLKQIEKQPEPASIVEPLAAAPEPVEYKKPSKRKASTESASTEFL